MDDFSGLVAGLDRGWRAEGDEAGFFAEGGAELHDAFADFGEHLRSEAAQDFLVRDVDDGGDEFQAVAGRRFGCEFVGETGEGALLENLQLLLGFFLVSQEGFEFFNDIARATAEVGADGGEGGFFVCNEVECRLTGDGFDATGAGGDGHLGDDFDKADFAGGADVGAAAELAAVTADIDDADELAVFVAEEREGSFGFLVELSLVGFDLGVVDDLGVDELLDLEELGVRDGFEVREIEAHAVGGLRGAGLADVGAEDFAERPMDQVRGGVMTVDGAAADHVHAERGRGVEGGKLKIKFGGNLVQVAAGFVLHAIGDREELAVDERGADIAGLAAHLRVERSLVENNKGVGVGRDDVDERRGGMGQFVSEERGRLEIDRGSALGGGDNNRFFGGGLAAFALLVHEALKFDGVDGESALGREELGHIEREAVGVVEFEGGGSVDGPCGCGFGEDGETTIERAAEALLFAADDAAHDFLALF